MGRAVYNRRLSPLEFVSPPGAVAMTSGLILNIQRYSVHDGPGIRTTVFLKGCPLRCTWCHNPESQAPEAEMAVAESRCIRCGACRKVCPNDGAASSSGRCTRCGACVEACPTGAREMLGREMTVGEVIAEVLKDRIFFDDSGGGVTFSGGEPLAQLGFLGEALSACRREGLHTAVDTCGYCVREDLLAVAPLTDLFLYDLKIIDDERHREHTGESNAMILDNLRELGQVHENIWLRIPVVPGVNDDAPQLEAAARLAASLPGVRRVNLLPYHSLGTRKASPDAKLAPPIEAATVDRLTTAAEPFVALGLHVETGG